MTARPLDLNRDWTRLLALDACQKNSYRKGRILWTVGASTGKRGKRSVALSRVGEPRGEAGRADANTNRCSIYHEIAEPRVASGNQLLRELDRSTEYQ